MASGRLKHQYHIGEKNIELLPIIWFNKRGLATFFLQKYTFSACNSFDITLNHSEMPRIFV
jgi:hypothetical protein